MSDIVSQKYCAACEHYFPATSEFFHKNQRSKDKLNNLCKSCNTKHSTAYKKKRRAALPLKLLKMHCPKGHPLVEENLRKGKRECLACHRERERARKADKPGPKRIPKKDGFCVNGHLLVQGNLRTGKNAGTCLTCHRESGQRRYHKNPEAMVAQVGAYARSHRDQINKRQREYRKLDTYKQRAHKSYLRHREQKRAAARRRYWGQRLEDSEQGVLYVEILYNDPCCYCGKPMQHIDHIVPIAKQGEEYWTNLTAACQRCNNRKRDKSLLEFLLYRIKYPDPKEEN